MTTVRTQERTQEIVMDEVCVRCAGAVTLVVLGDVDEVVLECGCGAASALA